MKKIYFLIFIITTISILTSCERDLMDYNGEDSIYFDVRRGNEFRESEFWARQYYTPVNFIKYIGDTIDINLPVAICGKVTDYDRTFEIEFVQDSSTAIEGTDFDCKTQWTLPAGESIGIVTVKAYRNEYLEDSYRTVVLKVKENKNFTTNMNFNADLSGRDKILEVDKKYNPDPRFHTLEMTIMAKKPTDWWGEDWPNEINPEQGNEFGPFGAFTSKKYLLMLDVLGFTENQFENAIKEIRRARVLGEIFAKYLVEQFENGTPILEKDGRLMWVEAVPYSKWRAYQYEW